MMETWYCLTILEFCGRQTQLSHHLLLLLPAHLKIKRKLLQLTRQRMLVNLQARRHHLVKLQLQHTQLLLMLLPRMLVLTQHKLLPLMLQKMLVKPQSPQLMFQFLLSLL